jgi:polysaccharide export outer membrane protein
MVALFNTTETSNTTTISSEKLYFSSYSVDKNGFIRIPYLNEINVLGYTTKEVRLKIESELSKMFKNMNDIFVTVKLAGIKYIVIGEVKSPGTNILFQNQVNIIEAIANAGDITMTGNRKEVTVIRQNIDGIKKYKLDLTGFDFMNSEGFIIQPNDVIYINPLKEKSWGTGETGAKTMTTIIASLSLIATTILLIKNL